MTEPVDARIERLRTRKPLGGLARAAITVGVLAVALSGGTLAYGAVQTAADANRAAESAARRTLTQAQPTPATQPSASAEPTPADPERDSEPAPTPAYRVFDADTDVSTIDLSGIPEWDDVENMKVWLQQQAVVADCMAEQGYRYTFSLYWERPIAAEPSNGDPGYVHALYGSDGNVGDAYRWQDAGCVGYAVHVTGQDDAH